MPDLPPIDVATIRKKQPLVNFVASDTDLTEYHYNGHHYWYGPCPFCNDGDDRFKVFINGGDGYQYFYCSVCNRGHRGGKGGDVIQFIMMTQNLDFVNACKWLDAAEVPEVPKSNTVLHLALTGQDLETWQERLEIMSQRALYELLTSESSGSRAALDWLAARGITSADVAKFGIGYNPRWRTILPDYKAPPGIWLPRWRYGGMTITAVNVYLSNEAAKVTGRKRQYIKGSQPRDWMYNEFRLGPKVETVVITEGELDAVLLGKYLPTGALSVATGGAEMIPANVGLLDGKRVIVIPDNDDGGTTFAGRWRERLPDCEIVKVPEGKDVTDYWKTGANLYQWVGEVLS